MTRHLKSGIQILGLPRPSFRSPSRTCESSDIVLRIACQMGQSLPRWLMFARALVRVLIWLHHVRFFALASLLFGRADNMASIEANKTAMARKMVPGATNVCRILSQ